MKKLILAAAVMSLAATPVSPADFWDIPARYMAGELIAPASIYDDLVPAEVHAFCGEYSACMSFTKGSSEPLEWERRFEADRCNVFVLQAKFYKLGDEGHRYAIEHELAHCRGWPPDHPVN